MAKKTLGAILREAKVGKTESSIARLIDNALVSGEISVGAFSVIGIKKQLKKLNDLADDFNRDEFFKEFFRLYNLVMAPDLRAKGVFHPSQIDTCCARQSTYELSGVPPTDKASRNIPASLQRIFDVGTWYHLYFQNLLYAIDVLEQAEVPVISKEKFINGKADGVIKETVFGERVVLEIKSMNNANYNRAVFQPFKKHEAQASIYAKELGINKVLYLYINKDTSDIKEFLRPLDEDSLSKSEKKMQSIIKHVEEKTLPVRSCKDKFSEQALACPFRALCFKD